MAEEVEDTVLLFRSRAHKSWVTGPYPKDNVNPPYVQVRWDSD